MRNIALRLALVLAVVVPACAPHTPPQVTAADAERGNVEIAELQQGRKLLLGKCAGCHRTPLPADHTPAEWPTIGLDPDARPSFADAAALFADHRQQVRDALAEVTDDQLDEQRTGTPVPAWGEETHDVRECFSVVLEELIEHRRFAERDLATLEARTAADVSGS